MCRRPLENLMSLAVLVCLVAHPGVASGQARGRGTPIPPTPAKARLVEATAAAKNWKADARLLQVAARAVGAEGLHVAWDYGFYSPAAKNCLVVNVVPGMAPNNRESGGAACGGPELKEFMDSVQALKIARSNGITSATVTMFATVSPTRQGERAVWTVMDGSGMKPGEVMLDIDAVTGAIVGKRTQ